jgi:primosomal protein N''
MSADRLKFERETRRDKIAILQKNIERLNDWYEQSGQEFDRLIDAGMEAGSSWYTQWTADKTKYYRQVDADQEELADCQEALDAIDKVLRLKL